MHTVPAKVVGEDFLANHIGQLLVRQPVKKNSEISRSSSSGASTIRNSDRTTNRQATRDITSTDFAYESSSHAKHASLSSTSVNPSAEVTANAKSPRNVTTPCAEVASKWAPAVQRCASLDRNSESSGSEPSSQDSRSNSIDPVELLKLEDLHLLRHHRSISESPVTPRVTFVTNFGSKPRRSSSRKSPSGTEATHYFNYKHRDSIGSSFSSHHSNASLSPLDNPGGISWNLPFRHNHPYPSFAQPIEEHRRAAKPGLQRGPDLTDSSNAIIDTVAEEQDEAASSTTSPGRSGGSTATCKSQSFSETSAPTRIRLTRALTAPSHSPTLHTHPMPSPPVSVVSSEKSMSASARSYKGQARMASLVPKAADGRTFRFIEPPSDVESDEYGDEHEIQPSTEKAQEVADTTVTSSRPGDSSGGSPNEVIACDSQDQRAISSDEQPTDSSSGSRLDSTARAEASSGSSETVHATPAIEWKSPASAIPPASSSSARTRRIAVRPRNPQQPTLLERTMASERGSHAGMMEVLGQRIERRSVGDQLKIMGHTTSRAAGKPQPPPPDSYYAIGYGEEQRSFRRRSAGNPLADFEAASKALSDKEDEANGNSGGDGSKQTPGRDHRTSEWARQQNQLASSPDFRPSMPATTPHSRDGSECPTATLPSPLLSPTASKSQSPHETCAPRPAAQPSQEMYERTNSHSSSNSSGSPNILGLRELAGSPSPSTSSDAGTTLSSQELESPIGPVTARCKTGAKRDSKSHYPFGNSPITSNTTIS